MHVSGEKGQALLIVVLVMVVALTVALSVASRSITNLRIATEQEDSQAAFSAAEAGIEQILKTGVTSVPDQGLGKANIKKTTIQQVGGRSEFVLNNGNPIAKDDSVDVWLVDHNADGSLNFSSGWHQSLRTEQLTIYWGATSDVCPDTRAAIEVIVMSGEAVLPVTTRYAIDPCDDRRGRNRFDSPNETLAFAITGTDKKFANRYTISVKNGMLVRIIPLYASASIAIKGCNHTADSCTNLPTQGKVIDSIGTSGQTVRKITYFQGYPKLPSEFFQYVLFSSQQ